MNFNYKTQETFNREFPEWLNIMYQDKVQSDKEYVKERYGKVYKRKLDKDLVSFDTYVKSVEEKIKNKTVSWMETIAFDANYREDFYRYKDLIKDLYYQYPLAKFYFKSNYAENDMIYHANKRLKEILTGIDLGDIKSNLIYEPSVNIDGNYKYILVDVFVQFYDEKTKISSEKLALLGLSLCWEEDEHYVKFKNEQAIRRMTKQFIEDVA